MNHLTSNTAARSGGARHAVVATALCGVQFVDVLGVTVLVTALPQMLDDLAATAAQGTVVITAYAMFFGGLLLVAARLGDAVGHRRIVLAALVVFAAASLLAALSASVWLLAAARAVQGGASAASVPAALSLLTTLIPQGPQRRRAVAGWSAAGAGAGALGFVVGGLLTELATWRLIFWVNIPLAAILALALVTVIPRDAVSRDGAGIAWGSALALTAAVMGIVVGATLLEDPARRALAAALLIAGALAGAGFVAAERASRHPLVPPPARRAPALRWGGFASFFNTATTSSSITVATFYLQGPLGLSPLQAAALLISFSVLVIAGAALTPRALAALGHRVTVAAGLATIATGNLMLVAAPTTVGIALAAATSGLGLGIASVAATDLGTNVADTLKGAASGILNTSAQLGTALGTAAIVLTAITLGPRPAWSITAAIALAAAATTLLRTPRPTSAAQEGAASR